MGQHIRRSVLKSLNELGQSGQISTADDVYQHIIENHYPAPDNGLAGVSEELELLVRRKTTGIGRIRMKAGAYYYFLMSHLREIIIHNE